MLSRASLPEMRAWDLGSLRPDIVGWLVANKRALTGYRYRQVPSQVLILIVTPKLPSVATEIIIHGASFCLESAYLTSGQSLTSES
jgi:hypothetical protein